MTSTGERILSWFDAAMFAFSGACKLFPIVPKLHQEMVTKFIAYSPICPTVYLGYTPSPEIYRTSVAVVELLCVVGVVMGSLDVQHISYGILMTVMTGALYTHVSLKEYSEMLVPFLLFITNLYLFTRQIIREKGVGKDQNKWKSGPTKEQNQWKSKHQ